MEGANEIAVYIANISIETSDIHLESLVSY